MKPHFSKARNTLRQTFGRRLLLLLGLFSLVMSVFIVLTYQYQTDRLNRSVMSGNLTHLVPRVEQQQRIWNTDADHLLDVIEWSGLLNLGDQSRDAKLQAFFTAQAESMRFEGIAITDAASGELLFDFWNNSENPELPDALTGNQPFWFDDRQSILYSRTRKNTHTLGHDLHVYFFKAWDSAMLRRLNFPDATIFISLGTKPLLSSGGNLALESSQPYTGDYNEHILNGIKYQEGSIGLADVLVENDRRLPLLISQK